MFPPKAKAKSAAKFDSYPDSKAPPAKGAPPPKKKKSAVATMSQALKEAY